MNYIGQILDFIQKLLVWWVTIMPWEEGVFIRGGKRTKIIKGGIHFRIPFYDQVYVQTTRMRVVQGPLQTVTTIDGKTITIVMNMGYTIEDIRLLYNTLYHADQTLCNMMMGIVADEVYARELKDCIPSQLEDAVKNKLKGEEFGLRFEYLKITGFAVVKTYRLIQDGHYLPDTLNTNFPRT